MSFVGIEPEGMGDQGVSSPMVVDSITDDERPGFTLESVRVMYLVVVDFSVEVVVGSSDSELLHQNQHRLTTCTKDDLTSWMTQLS